MREVAELVVAPSEAKSPIPDYLTPTGSAISIPYNGSIARLAFGPRVNREVRAWLRGGGFDVVHVGLGPDAHVCSLFPGHPAALAVKAPAVAVRNSPKPPPERYSLTFDALQHAGRIMVVAGGEGKAEAVRLGLGAPDVLKAPASCCRGKQTTWYLDKQANALMTD